MNKFSEFVLDALTGRPAKGFIRSELNADQVHGLTVSLGLSRMNDVGMTDRETLPDVCSKADGIDEQLKDAHGGRCEKKEN